MVGPLEPALQHPLARGSAPVAAASSWTRAAGTSPSSRHDDPWTAVVRGTARSHPSTGRTAPRVSAGSSRRKRCIGSCTRVPARASASISTSGVRLRKSPAVLDMLLSKVAWAWLWRGQ